MTTWKNFSPQLMVSSSTILRTSTRSTKWKTSNMSNEMASTDFCWTLSLHFLEECPISVVPSRYIQVDFSSVTMDKEGAGLGFEGTIVGLMTIRTLMIVMTWTSCWCRWKGTALFVVLFTFFGQLITQNLNLYCLVLVCLSELLRIKCICY